MKRFVNVRVPVLFACALAAGAAAGLAFSYFNTDLFWSIAIVPVAAILFVVLLLLRKPKLLIISAAIILIFTGAFFNCYTRIEKYKVCETGVTQTCYITGKVVEKGISNSKEYLIIGGAAADGERLSGKIRVYLSSSYGDYCDIGYFVGFYSELAVNDAFTYGNLNYNAEKNIKYSCSVSDGLHAERGFSFFGGIRSSIRETLYDNLDGDTADVLYAMLLGNTENVDNITLQNIRYGGIAHVFAVSGLHIGLIFGIVNFICRKLRLNKYVTAVLCCGVILFYAGVCGFTLSSMRAVIMCATALITGLIHVKKDGLNSLAFAVIVILSVSPLSLFSVGFQLSVCAVGGIFICSGFFGKLFTKIKAPRKISSAVGSSFGAQLGTFPVMLANFGYVSGAGIILNIVVLPVISIFFIFVFLATVIGAVIPPLGNLLYYAAIPLDGILSFLIDAGFEKSLITGFGAGCFVPLYFIALLFVSDKLNFGKLSRALGLIVCVAVLTIFVVVKAHLPFNGFDVYISGYYSGGNVVIKSKQGTVLIMTEKADVSQAISSLNENYSLNPDAVIIIGGEECAAAFDPETGGRNVYISNLYLPVQPYNGVEFHYESEFEVCGISFEFTDGYTIKCDLDGATVTVCAGKILNTGYCDLLVSENLNYNKETHEAVCSAGETVYFSQKGYRYNTYEYGSLKYRVRNGELIKI